MMLPKHSQPYCAYACEYTRVDVILSLFTTFNKEMGNRGNNADFHYGIGLLAVNGDVTETQDC